MLFTCPVTVGHVVPEHPLSSLPPPSNLFRPIKSAGQLGVATSADISASFGNPVRLTSCTFGGPAGICKPGPMSCSTASYARTQSRGPSSGRYKASPHLQRVGHPRPRNEGRCFCKLRWVRGDSNPRPAWITYGYSVHLSPCSV